MRPSKSLAFSHGKSSSVTLHKNNRAEPTFAFNAKLLLIELLIKNKYGNIESWVAKCLTGRFNLGHPPPAMMFHGQAFRQIPTQQIRKGLFEFA
jgi:hypothetical protein